MNVRVLRMLSLVLGVALAGLFATSCTDSTDPGVLITLKVAPSPATVAAGGTVQFSAVGTDFTGASVTPNAGTVVWSVASGGGTINSSTGLFTASTTPGTYTNTIVATCRGITASATVIITAGPLATITVTPNPTLAIGAQQTFTAVGKDAFGNIVAITPTWTTTIPAGMSVAPGTIVSGTGVFTAGNTLGVFTNSVRATQGTIFGTATVTVIAGPLTNITVTPNPVTLAVGAAQTFTAVGTDAGGNVVPINPAWTVTNGGGTIPAGTTGQTAPFTAGNTAGSFANTVRATQGTIFGTATVNVVAGPLATITVTPNPVTLAIGAAQTFTAAGTDANGNVVAINPTWTVTNGGGTIPAGTTGQTAPFTAGNTPGAYANTVRATQGTIFGTATVNVIAGPVATITVTPNPATLAVGNQVMFTAVGKDAAGNTVTINPTWTVTNGGGTVPAGSTGTTVVFTATTAGTFDNTVRATQGTIFGTATVIVTAPAARFGVIARVAVTCTLGSITGSVGTNQSPSEVPPGSVTGCTLATPEIGTPAAKQQYAAFVTEYISLAATPCGTTLSGTLAGQTLTPGVYCFPAAATLTGTLTLNGVGDYKFLVGTSGTGALSTTNFNIVLSNSASACSVKWWVKQAATMVDSDFKGNILAGAGVSMTRGTFVGNAWSQEDVTFTGTTATGCP